MSNVPVGPAHPDDDLERELTLVELVNRVLDRGVVLRGDVVISVADVDLVYLWLHLVLTSSEQLHRRQRGPAALEPGEA